MCVCVCVRQVGDALHAALASGGLRRSDLFVTSKCWNSEHGRVREACVRSLRALRLDYLDLYLMHCKSAGPRNAGRIVASARSEVWPATMPLLHRLTRPASCAPLLRQGRRARRTRCLPRGARWRRWSARASSVRSASPTARWDGCARCSTARPTERSPSGRASIRWRAECAPRTRPSRLPLEPSLSPLRSLWTVHRWRRSWSTSTASPFRASSRRTSRTSQCSTCASTTFCLSPASACMSVLYQTRTHAAAGTRRVRLLTSHPHGRSALIAAVV